MSIHAALFFIHQKWTMTRGLYAAKGHKITMKVHCPKYLLYCSMEERKSYGFQMTQEQENW